MQTEPSTPASLRERLRSETASAHHALEADLNLLGGHADPLRVRRLLERFHGFHAAWEPALAERLADPGFVTPRSKLDALRSDLLQLGAEAAAIDALPHCEAATALAATEVDALGALYVMEGSTLGGKLITRHLSSLPWWPRPGLRYFDPYGADTGRRWRESLARIEGAPPDAYDRIVESADAAFRLLHHWLLLPSYSTAECGLT